MSNPLSDLKALVDRIDLKRIAAIAKQVDLAKLVDVFAQLEPEDLAHLASQVRAMRARPPGFEATKIEDKMALRIVQNAEITMTDCLVGEARRLQNASSFKDTARVLRMTRAGVAWQAVGCARGAYEHTVRYVQARQQFGRPIGSFQRVQDLVANMLSQLTAMQSLVFRLSQMQDAGTLRDEHASLAKVFCTSGCREVVSQARELHGGNGILLSHDVARFVADSCQREVPRGAAGGHRATRVGGGGAEELLPGGPRAV
jgi:glutaryl-CoA dehydrogenase